MSPEKVPMGDSVVLAMQSSRHDMYSSCHHSLEEGVRGIFNFSAATATRATCRVLGGNGRDSNRRSERIVRFRFKNAEIAVPDLLHVYNERDFAFDEKYRLLSAWRECVAKMPELADANAKWEEASKILTKEAAGPDMWAALLAAVPNHAEFFRDDIWPMLRSRELLSCWHFKTCVDPCVKVLAKTAGPGDLNDWQEIVLALTPKDLHDHNYPDNLDALERLKSSYLLCLPDPALSEPSRRFLVQCKAENISEYHPSQPREFTPEERLVIARQQNGVDASNPLHLQLESDLAFLTSLKRAGPYILKRIAEIDARFAEADERLQSRMRGQFQNGISWALLNLARGGARLNDKQSRKMLELCEGLLDTQSGIDNALEAIGLALSKKRKLTKKQRELLDRIVARPEPKIVERFGYYVWAFLSLRPEWVWDCLDLWTRRMDEDEVANALGRALHDSWFWWLFHADRQRALKQLERMLATARRFNRTGLVAGFLAWFAALAIREGESRSRKVVEIALSKPEVHGIELADVVRVLVEWQLPRDPRGAPPAENIERVSALSRLFFDSAHKALQQLHHERRLIPPDQGPKEAAPWVKSVAERFDHFAREIRFSAENHIKSPTIKCDEDFKKAAESWWGRAEPLFVQLEKWLHPHSSDHLIHALAEWGPFYATRCLHRLRRLCESGIQTNLLYRASGRQQYYQNS